MYNRQSGFTLAEIAIAVLVMSLLLSASLMTLSAQFDMNNTAETRRTLERARDALVGYAVANGRLPCPALGSNPLAASDIGSEVVESNDCKNPAGKTTYLPARDLGLTPLNTEGFLIDAWGNPIRYAVTGWKPAGWGKPPFRTTDATLKLPEYVEAHGFPDSGTSLLEVCEAEAANACTSADATITRQAIAILFSAGKDATADASNDDNDNAFVGVGTSPEFDDILLWISPYTLYNRMIAAGTL